MIAKKRAKAREGEENDVEDAPGRERRDGEDVEETYDDGGDEATFVKDKPRVAAAFLRKANESSSKASIKGLVDGEAMYRIGRACQMAGRYNRALLAYETATHIATRRAARLERDAGVLGVRRDVSELADGGVRAGVF